MKYVWKVYDVENPDMLWLFTSEKKAIAFIDNLGESREYYRYKKVELN